MTQEELAERIQRYITVDTSGLDLDMLEIRGEDGKPKRMLMQRPLYDMVDYGTVTLPDGTTGFSRDDLQLAFQNAHIAAYGVCVLEAEFANAGFPELAKIARSARGAK
jgi:hypothetical protein